MAIKDPLSPDDLKTEQLNLRNPTQYFNTKNLKNKNCAIQMSYLIKPEKPFNCLTGGGGGGG